MQQDNGCARSALEVGDAPSLDADFGHISLLALTNKSTAECSAVYHVFLFSILQQRDRLKYPAVAKILSKDINPANAAILAVHPDIGPQYI
jgi:hypothetical protein